MVGKFFFSLGSLRIALRNYWHAILLETCQILIALGGFLVTQGVYTGVEDFRDKIVRQLIVFLSLPGEVTFT